LERKKESGRQLQGKVRTEVFACVESMADGLAIGIVEHLRKPSKCPWRIVLAPLLVLLAGQSL
jgi:hypothetical protein